MTHLFRLFVSLGVLALLGSSCASARKPATRSPVLVAQRTDLKQDPPRSGPFDVMRRTTSPAVLKSAQHKTALTVLPVDLRHLKPPARGRAKLTPAQYAQTPGVQEISSLLRTRFQEEANRYASPRRGNFLTLQLALTEFTPTSAGGNVVKTAAGFFVGPLTLLASPLTRGTLAIEGEVRDPATGRIVFQFSDRESDPMTIFSVRSYKRTGFARIIIDQWAAQLPRALRNSTGVKQKDAPGFRLSPF